KKKEKQEQAKKTLFQIKKEDVSEIRLEGLDQPVDIVAATKDAWRMVSPIAGKADGATVDRIVGDFSDFKYRDVISDKTQDASGYGLDIPQRTVHIGLKSG